MLKSHCLVISVTIRGTANHGFKGLQMAAFKASNGEEAVGTFLTFDSSKYKAFTCHGGYKVACMLGVAVYI